MKERTNERKIPKKERKKKDRNQPRRKGTKQTQKEERHQ